jgi:uncharacterized protein YecE (DUF72 family)
VFYVFLVNEGYYSSILVGTASWQEPDFIEYWYPKGLAKSQLLPYYAEHFSYVEVNGTFYGIPQARITEQWCEQTPDGFVFDIKLHRLLSRHSTEAKFLPPDIRPLAQIISGKVELTAKIEKLVAEKFIAGIQPLLDAGKLGVLLLQLSPSFRPHSNTLSELDNILALFHEFPLAVELRNRNWLDGEQTAATVDYFKSRNVTLVSVDAPEAQHFTIMPNVDFITSERLGYLRLHRRDPEAYIKGKTVQERFDYDYTEEELIKLAQRITGIADTTKAVHVVFNNNRRDFAPKAAARLITILRGSTKLTIAKPFKKQPELI